MSGVAWERAMDPDIIAGTRYNGLTLGGFTIKVKYDYEYILTGNAFIESFNGIPINKKIAGGRIIPYTSANMVYLELDIWVDQD